MKRRRNDLVQNRDVDVINKPAHNHVEHSSYEGSFITDVVG